MRRLVLLGSILALALGWAMLTYAPVAPLPPGDDPRRLEYRWCAS